MGQTVGPQSFRLIFFSSASLFQLHSSVFWSFNNDFLAALIFKITMSIRHSKNRLFRCDDFFLEPSILLSRHLCSVCAQYINVKRFSRVMLHLWIIYSMSYWANLFAETFWDFCSSQCHNIQFEYNLGSIFYYYPNGDLCKCPKIIIAYETLNVDIFNRVLL